MLVRFFSATVANAEPLFAIVWALLVLANGALLFGWVLGGKLLRVPAYRRLLRLIGYVALLSTIYVFGGLVLLKPIEGIPSALTISSPTASLVLGVCLSATLIWYGRPNPNLGGGAR